jgi:CheY-like chemotaxis protein
LCVDDSPLSLEVCKEILEAGGFRVLCAGSGSEALAFLKMHPVDAAVIDHQMPEMSGIDLAREMKLIDSELKIVMYSGSFRGHDQLVGIDICLSKGEGPLALRRLLVTLLKR